MGGNEFWGPWNFNPNTKLTIKAGTQETSSTAIYSGTMPFAPIASLSDYSQAPLTIYNAPTGPSAKPAVIAFIRSGNWGAFFGLDTDNVLKVGGGNLGANAYPIIHAGNYNSYINQALVQVGLGGVGSYAALAVYDTSAPAASVGPGAILDGSVLFYSSFNASFRSGTKPTGTWRCMGYVFNRDGTNPDSAALFQRVT